MNKVKSVVLIMGILFSFAINSYSQDQQKRKEELPTDLNGDYKHRMPSQEKDTIQKSFNYSSNSINRNYKQQNRPIRKVRFRDHVRNEEKRNSISYKHPNGL